MGLTGDPALMGEIGGIVIGGTILLIGLIFVGGDWLSDDKDNNSPVSGVTGQGKIKKSKIKRHKKGKNTKKKR